MSAFHPLRTLSRHALYSEMTRCGLLSAPLFLLAFSLALAEDVRPLTATTATQMLGISDPDAKTIVASWRGQPTVFVEYVTDKATVTVCDPAGWDEPPSQHVDILTGERDKEIRRLVAVQQTPDGKLQSTVVTDIQSDAHFSDVAAIGFANADRDSDHELIVIVRWETSGGVGGGSDYQIRLFDRPDPSKPCLSALKEMSDHFGVQYEGLTFDTGEPVHARFMTVKAVKKELRRLGY